MITARFLARHRPEVPNTHSANPRAFVVVAMKCESIVWKEGVREIAKTSVRREFQPSCHTTRPHRFIEDANGYLSDADILTSRGSPVGDLASFFEPIPFHNSGCWIHKRPKDVAFSCMGPQFQDFEPLFVRQPGFHFEPIDVLGKFNYFGDVKPKPLLFRDDQALCFEPRGSR